jgi:hypothetical protein
VQQRMQQQQREQQQYEQQQQPQQIEAPTGRWGLPVQDDEGRERMYSRQW